MDKKDADRAERDGYAAGRNGEPSRPPNAHGLIYETIFSSREEARADDAYRKGFKEGAEDRKRHK